MCQKEKENFKLDEDIRIQNSIKFRLRNFYLFWWASVRQASVIAFLPEGLSSHEMRRLLQKVLLESPRQREVGISS